jgi:hypothetical protein
LSGFEAFSTKDRLGSARGKSARGAVRCGAAALTVVSLATLAQVEKRTQYMIEVMFAIRKDGFKDHPAIPEGLDLVRPSGIGWPTRAVAPVGSLHHRAAHL